MNVLIACEESQRVCIEYRKRGHISFSCDVQECSGGFPEWHIKGDVLPLLNGNCEFTTSDSRKYILESKWDLIIAHPPCTYLTVTGNRWFNVEKYGDKARQRLNDRNEAVDFFMKFVNADCEKIAIENPVGIMSNIYRKPDQYIEPYYFGDFEKKKTGLWLKGLPKLKPTNIVEPVIIQCKSGVNEPRWHMETINLSKDERSRIRSKTFIGIAKAFAEQWG